MGIVAELVCLALWLYMMAIFVRVLLSWFPLNPQGAMATVAGFLYVITDVVLAPLRRNLPPVRIGNAALDLSPMIVIFGLIIFMRLIC